MSDQQYECKTLSETGMMIGLGAGIAVFIGLAYLGYATGQGWLAIVGFPLILIGILAAQRRSIYGVGPDGLAVRNEPARAWAYLSSPGERLVRFDEIQSTHLQLGQGSRPNNFVVRTKDGVRIPITQDRLERDLPQWRLFLHAFAMEARNHGLGVVGIEKL